MHIKSFFDKDSNTFSYVVHDGKHCAIIDSVLGYNSPTASIDTQGADTIIGYVRNQNLTVEWILETHIHSDHLSAAHYLKTELGGKIAISRHIETVQDTFSKIYNEDFKSEHGDSFDYFFEDDEKFTIGTLSAQALYTPGHTPACLSFLIEDAVFVGDTLFMPDYGTARCDFPNGSAEDLYDSVQKLYALPDETVVYLCHDYLPPTRDNYCNHTTIGEQRLNNIHLKDSTKKDTFVAMRTRRDSVLSAPEMFLASIQTNLRTGKLPKPEENGVSYLKIPLNMLHLKR